MFQNTYKGKRVFVTGHTGFKGSWLSQWLLNMGADVTGFSNEIPTEPSHFEALKLAEHMTHIIGDIRDADVLEKAVRDAKPDILFHLAAQPIVRRSYEDPALTFHTNTLGTMNILEALRLNDHIGVGVIITSDKAYRNVEWKWGYRENDELGGEDPYSASKGAAELIARSYVESYFSRSGAQLVATTRAGNVIGGGDWAADRIVPDAMRAWSKDEVLQIRNPNATRPWQHVLEPLSGYLWLGASLYNRRPGVDGRAFNFGPLSNVNQSVAELLKALSREWGGGEWHAEIAENPDMPEANLLKLNCDLAEQELNWTATWEFDATMEMTAGWYKAYYDNPTGDIASLTVGHIERYERDAQNKGLKWAQE